MLFKLLDILRNSICSLKSPFFRRFVLRLFNDPRGVASSAQCESVNRLYKSAKKSSIFSGKANYARCLFILLSTIPGFHEPWGKDADLKYEVTQTAYSKPLSPLGYLAQQLIRFHQQVISPVDGPRSHFRPSSSGYMLQAIHKHGFFQGYIMGCDRLLRENSDPWVYRTTLIDGQIWKTDSP